MSVKAAVILGDRGPSPGALMIAFLFSFFYKESSKELESSPICMEYTWRKMNIELTIVC